MSDAKTFVYFSDSRCLRWEDLRRSCLRLPEVMSEVYRLQKDWKRQDVVLTAWDSDLFLQLSETEQRHLCNVIQRGLFERLKKRLPSQSLLSLEILRSSEELDALLRKKSQTSTEVPKAIAEGPVKTSATSQQDSSTEFEVWLIGPEKDRACLKFEAEGGKLRDFLAEDPLLREVFGPSQRLLFPSSHEKRFEFH